MTKTRTSRCNAGDKDRREEEWRRLDCSDRKTSLTRSIRGNPGTKLRINGGTSHPPTCMRTSHRSRRRQRGRSDWRRLRALELRSCLLITQCPGHDTTLTVTAHITVQHLMTPTTVPRRPQHPQHWQTRFWWWSPVTLDSGDSIPYSLIAGWCPNLKENNFQTKWTKYTLKWTTKCRMDQI